MTTREILEPSDIFISRHIGPGDDDVRAMLRAVGAESLEALTGETVPSSIRMTEDLRLAPPESEHELLARLRGIAQRNNTFRSLIGMGYYDTITPPVIQRNILENPGWYTQYTPYQPEISQGRLEALLNFQTMVADLTGLPLANASLLDEATAAAEAMSMCRAITKAKKPAFIVADDCHPQTLAVVQGRAEPIGIDVRVCRPEEADFAGGDVSGILLQYPTTDGRIEDYEAVCRRARDSGALVVMATDLLALTLLRPPGEIGADMAIGSSQRFGVPLGFGGPHAAFLSTREDYKRHVPGRLIGVSKDSRGDVAYRLALQTREQHIRRDRATSNICTAQVLLAIMAGMYAVHHGPGGLRRIAERVRGWTAVFAEGLRRLGHEVPAGPVFDTLRIPVDFHTCDRIVVTARSHRINLRRYGDHALGVSLDELTTAREVEALLEAFACGRDTPPLDDLIASANADYEAPHARKTAYLTHPVFNKYHPEHELLRYIHRLQERDLSLTTSMIPLGSCTMKLNGTSEMLPVTWPEFGSLHPFAPPEQSTGYQRLFDELKRDLGELTGFPAVSLQPNAGAQGEYAGLLCIRSYHRDRGQGHRNVCLIPTSAHGTNPASASMVGFKVVAVACDAQGNIDMDDLRSKASEHGDRLAAIMVTYPSTHGVFERTITEICQVVHDHGGQVYLDGANMNAQLGVCRPGDYGTDVVHLNLHKTFCIPHGGGGPGMGPIAVAEHLAPYLPGHPIWQGDREKNPPVAAAPFGSPSILPISWMYIKLMGAEGLTRATQVAILNANYMAARLRDHFDILYTGASGRVAHEFILDLRPFKKSAGVEVDDVAKRLMDFGFHAPTMSWPVPGTLMVEPTESESKAELDRFCDAMIAIREEIRALEEARMPKDNNPLKNAPHTTVDLVAPEWNRPYSREQAVYPAAHLREHKYWPPVGRVDNAYGDRNLVCSCPPLESYL